MNLILLSMVLYAAAEDVLLNGGFDAGLDGWRPNTPGIAMEVVRVDDRTAARVVVPPETPVGFPCLYQEVPVCADEVFQCTVTAMGRGVKDGHGVYAACEFHDAGGRLSFVQTWPVRMSDTWQTFRVRMVVPRQAATLRVCLLLHGHGEAFFDQVELVRLPSFSREPLDGPVTITVTDEVVCDSLIGFGAEDDGWFYNEENAAHGVTEEDYAIREGRVEWMDPDYVRMFCWYRDWNPKGDWETFTFDSPNMESHYRTLDLYQRLGARVNVTGVEWNVEDPYRDPARFARALGALFEHVIRVKGYTCVQDWTLTNEPNTYFERAGYTFERFVELHVEVKEEFARRGLSVRIVGSDDTDGFPLFEKCVKNDAYFDAADYFGSHRYFPYADRVFAPYFFDERLGLLRGRKPFVVGEFGFQDGRATHLLNPVMEEYPYALWTTAFIVEGLNRGVAGFSVWCLHEVYYPGNGFMNYGIWDFKDNDWAPRPVYHAFAMFSRLTEAGDEVRRCSSSHPSHVIAALVKGAAGGGTLFWVNRGEQAAEVRLVGFAPETLRVMTEDALEGDRECGVVARVENGSSTIPPQSFGFCVSAGAPPR